MNSQNTPVHIRLWHRDFWLMAIANLLLTSAVYMLVPTMPQWLVETQGLTIVESGIAMATFGVGLFVFCVIPRSALSSKCGLYVVCPGHGCPDRTALLCRCPAQ